MATAFDLLQILAAAPPSPQAFAAQPPSAPVIPARAGTYVPGPYVTALSPADEQRFQSWVKANKVPWQDSPTSDYDMRGYWKAMSSGDPKAKQAGNLHFPDTYKTPYHATFSNESQYATPNAPKWVGDKLIATDGTVVADETPKAALSPAAAAKIRATGGAK